MDEVAFANFLEEFKIESGLIVGDKAFRQKSAKRAFEGRPGLHWMHPLKRNAAIIRQHAMYEWEGVLPGCGRDVKFRKEEIRGGKFLYSFYDRSRAAKEEADWFRRNKGREYDRDKADAAAERFGTVVFESDLDMDPLAVWKCYEDRWDLEVAFNYYKQALGLDETRVQSDESVIGSEFVNFVATVITMRLVKTFDELHLLDKMSYGKIMEELRGATMVSLDGEEWTLAQTTKHAQGTLRTLELLDENGCPVRSVAA